MGNALSAFYPEVAARGLTHYDGSIQFYGRVSSLLSPQMLDLGAGRGRQSEGKSPFRKDLTVPKGKVAKVTGVDVGDAVLSNPERDEAVVMPKDNRKAEDVFTASVQAQLPAQCAPPFLERMLKQLQLHVLARTGLSPQQPPDRLIDADATVLGEAGRRAKPDGFRAEEVTPAGVNGVG